MKTSQQLQKINKRLERMPSVMPVRSKKEQHQEGSGTIPLLEESETLEYTKEEERGAMRVHDTSPEEVFQSRCHSLPFLLRVFDRIDDAAFWKDVDLVRSQGLDFVLCRSNGNGLNNRLEDAMRFVPLLSSVYLFVFAGDMVWLFTSHQANEPTAVIWWAEVIASAGFAVFGLIGAILSARRLWREEVHEAIDVKGTAMTEHVPPAGVRDSAMSNSLTGNESVEKAPLSPRNR
jgi:hypothetical protein